MRTLILMSLFIALSLAATPLLREVKAAEYADVLLVRVSEGFRNGAFHKGEVLFERPPDGLEGEAPRTVYIQGCAVGRAGETMEAVERRAVVDALSRIAYTQGEKTAHVAQRVLVQDAAVALDETHIREYYLVGPDLSVVERKVEGAEMTVTVRVPMRPWDGRKPAAGWIELLGAAPRELGEAFEEAGRSAGRLSTLITRWMNRVGAEIRPGPR